MSSCSAVTFSLAALMECSLYARNRVAALMERSLYARNRAGHWEVVSAAKEVSLER